MANYKSAISFGLVHIPVALNPIIRNNDTSFNQLHKKCHNRIKYLKYCPHCDEEVKQKDLIKAFEYSKDEYVEFTEKDFDKLISEEEKNLDIISFVKIEEINPIYYEKSFYLETDSKNKAFSLFKAALKKEKKVAVVKTVLGNKTYYAILRFNDKNIIMTTLYFEEEIKETIETEDNKFNERELSLAIELIKNMTDEFKPETYTDDYQDKIKEAIELKIQGKGIKPVKSKKTKSINDLIGALEESIKRKKKKK